MEPNRAPCWFAVKPALAATFPGRFTTIEPAARRGACLLGGGSVLYAWTLLR
jgi:hypothetical protein